MVALPNAAPKKHDGPFGGVPLSLAIDSTISDGAKVTYAYLAAVTYSLKPNALPPTRDEIARDRSISPATVTNHVKELVRRDWLVAWHYVCRVGVINAYWAFESTDACRRYRADNPSLSYVTFDDETRDISRPSRKGVGGNRKQVKRGTRSTQVDHPLDQLKLITPTTRSTQVDQGSANPVDHVSAHSYKRESNTEINTDVRVLTSPADAGQGALTPQNYDSMSDHVDGSDEMVGEPPEPFTSWDQVEQYDKTTAEIDKQQREYWKDKEVGEIFPVTHEDPPQSSGKVPPNRVTVNANNTTIIKPHDPIFDSVAKLQFGISDTSDMPMTTTKTGKRRSVFGARIQSIVNVIVDQYKLRNNVTALTTQEREGLAAIHVKFWTWYTEVKYPARNGETISQLRDDEKFAEYWIEYRAYRNAPKAEPPQDVIPIARVGITTEMPKAGGEWGKR